MRRFASLRRRSDFAKVRQRGRVIRTADLTVYHSAAAADPRTLVGISIGKTVAGAVLRNKLRRRLQSILQTVLDDIPQRLLIVPKPSAALLSFAELTAQLRRVLGAASTR
ncbi:MAG: ribonuclease P protein component [Candidatus Eremiobacteraeota bacterium]|nr:ribonuclease P protein component [Candidatus Eremiobacteraeota bacterium]